MTAQFTYIELWKKIRAMHICRTFLKLQNIFERIREYAPAFKCQECDRDDFRVPYDSLICIHRTVEKNQGYAISTFLKLQLAMLDKSSYGNMTFYENNKKNANHSR